MADMETIRAALLDSPKLPFRITSGQRLLPGRCWSGSRQAASIRSISRTGRAKPLTLVIPCRRSLAAISPASSKQSAAMSRRFAKVTRVCVPKT